MDDYEGYPYFRKPSAHVSPIGREVGLCKTNQLYGYVYHKYTQQLTCVWSHLAFSDAPACGGFNHTKQGVERRLVNIEYVFLPANNQEMLVNIVFKLNHVCIYIYMYG